MINCAVALVPIDGVYTVDEQRFLGIKCVKGRGLICPGGKFENIDSTYHGCVIRECYEETGFQATNPVYLWHGPDVDGANVFAFVCSPMDSFVFNETFDYIETSSGRVMSANFSDLLTSRYGAWYAVIQDEWRKYREHLAIVKHLKQGL